MPFSVQIFADGADIHTINSLSHHPLITGFTTNPSLMKQCGVKDYVKFCRHLVELIPNHSVSFEVFADDIDQMYEQALKISAFGPNVFVKIPIMNTLGQSTARIIKKLTTEGHRVNVTAILTHDQIQEAIESIAIPGKGYISIFAGRIADTGRDPVDFIKYAVDMAAPHPHVKILWASTREFFNIIQANRAGCHIITVPYHFIPLLENIDKDLYEVSKKTVCQFYTDGQDAGFLLD
jgi:transaldolase